MASTPEGAPELAMAVASRSRGHFTALPAVYLKHLEVPLISAESITGLELEADF